MIQALVLVFMQNETGFGYVKLNHNQTKNEKKMMLKQCKYKTVSWYNNENILEQKRRTFRFFCSELISCRESLGIHIGI